MIQTVTNSVKYAPNGVGTLFVIPFPFYDNAHIQVLLITNAVAATLVLNVDYTLTGVNNAGGGTATLTNPPAVGTTLQINRIVPLSQLTSYALNGAFPSTSHERQMDLMVMMIQQLQQQLSQAVLAPLGGFPPNVTLSTDDGGNIIYTPTA